jgi:hypothetical protein
MNELERLIVAVDRPEPGHKLDARVNAILVQSQHRSKKSRWKNALVSCAAAACVGAIGFYAGRLSASPATDPLPAIASATRVHSRPERAPVAANVMKVPLTDNQLAGLFVLSNHREGLLGSGPLTTLTSTSP